MALIVVPSDKKFKDLRAVDQALVRAQTLLQKGMPTDPDAHKQRFDFFTRKARGSPFVELQNCDETCREWDQEVNVREVFRTLLPPVVMSAVEPQIELIQDTVDDRAKIESFLTFFWSEKSGEKHVAQFCIQRIPKWGASKFEVHFVEIHASFSSGAVFGIEVKSASELKAKYCFREYSVNTAMLQKEMAVNYEQVESEMEEWDNAVKAISS